MRYVQLRRKKQFHHHKEKLWTWSATQWQAAAHAVRPEMGTDTRILDLSVCVCLSPHWPGTACTHTHTHPAQDLHILSSLGCFLALLWATCTSLSGPWPPPSETTALASFSPRCLFCHTLTQNVAFLTVTWVTLALHGTADVVTCWLCPALPPQRPAVLPQRPAELGCLSQSPLATCMPQVTPFSPWCGWVQQFVPLCPAASHALTCDHSPRLGPKALQGPAALTESAHRLREAWLTLSRISAYHYLHWRNSPSLHEHFLACILTLPFNTAETTKMYCTEAQFCSVTFGWNTQRT